MNHRNTATRPRSTTVLALAIAAALPLCLAGCIEIQALLQGDNANSGGSGTPSTNSPNENTNINDDGGTPAPPTVRITTSSPVPLLAEQVTLRCTTVAGDEAVTYAFSPNDILIVDADAGTATFIVNEPDLGSDLQFTCAGTNDAGTGPTSDPISIIPQ